MENRDEDGLGAAELAVFGVGGTQGASARLSCRRCFLLELGLCEATTVLSSSLTLFVVLFVGLGDELRYLDRDAASSGTVSIRPIA